MKADKARSLRSHLIAVVVVVNFLMFLRLLFRTPDAAIFATAADLTRLRDTTNPDNYAHELQKMLLYTNGWARSLLEWAMFTILVTIVVLLILLVAGLKGARAEQVDSPLLTDKPPAAV